MVSLQHLKVEGGRGRVTRAAPEVLVARAGKEGRVSWIVVVDGLALRVEAFVHYQVRGPVLHPTLAVSEARYTVRCWLLVIEDDICTQREDEGVRVLEHAPLRRHRATVETPITA